MIQINYNDSRPIYEKVKDSLRQLILSGALPEDSRLPSVRELAMSLTINPNTIQRAYRELEASGYHYTVPGKGKFAGDRREVDEGRKQALLDSIRAAAKELRYLGVPEETLLRAVSEGGKHDD